MPDNKFFTPKIIINKVNKVLSTSLKVGRHLIDDAWVDREVYIRWPNGDEEIIIIDYGLFPDDNNNFTYEPFFIADLHGIDINIMLSDIPKIKVPG
jgi:hypothetical protein